MVLVVGCGPQGWAWQRYSTLTDFGSFSGLDARGAPIASTIDGPRRFDAESYVWKRIETPGAAAKFSATVSGREFASTYGLYTRERSSAAWSLLPGSRALALEFVGQDAAGHLYARSGPADFFVQLSGTQTWLELVTDPSLKDAFHDPRGTVYLSDAQRSRLARLDGSTVVALAHPTATGFDLDGRRYQAVLPFKVERVDDDGQLTIWHTLSGAGTPVLSALYGFGKDGRFYALAQNAPEGSDFASGDMVSIGQGEKRWRLAASPVSDGAGNSAGLASFQSYGGGFERDGAMYFGGCESGCDGRGNAFSYGLFKLTLGGQP